MLADNLFDFWFRFVYPNTDELEIGNIESVFRNHIKPELNSHIGKHFENIILEILNERNMFN